MNVTKLKFDGARLIEPKLFRDERGSFLETWHAQRYESEVTPLRFVQDNVSRSIKGVIRGLHFQHPHGQAKLISVLKGVIYDVMVDVRTGSPTFGEWQGVELDAEEGQQLFIPSGFAHGFAALSDEAIFSYKCTDVYSHRDEATLLWNDPDLGIEWPIESPILSAKDAAGIRLRDFPTQRLPRQPINRTSSHPFVVAVL